MVKLNRFYAVRTEYRFERERRDNEKPWLDGKSGGEFLCQYHSADFSFFPLHTRHYEYGTEHFHPGSGGDFSCGLDL